MHSQIIRFLINYVSFHTEFRQQDIQWIGLVDCKVFHKLSPQEALWGGRDEEIDLKAINRVRVSVPLQSSVQAKEVSCVYQASG